ncbi:hypothetical protein, partial [Bifidobacterium avesanii]|uniref:hypothetical protein n=1 Tax=Bifidobacterium avesanii TaxID=1798157 RepID=UPI0019535279
WDPYQEVAGLDEPGAIPQTPWAGGVVVQEKVRTPIGRRTALDLLNLRMDAHGLSEFSAARTDWVLHDIGSAQFARLGCSDWADRFGMEPFAGIVPA